MSARPRSPKRWFPPPEFYAPGKCRRCGVCCGSTDGHPCEYLAREASGLYFCKIYDTRLAKHRTVDGMEFVCVEIRHIIEAGGGYEGCSYVDEIRRLREQMGLDTSDLGRMKHP